MALLIGIISLILNIVIYPLCKIRYRDEDAVGIAEGKLQIKSKTRHFPQSCWALSLLFLMIAIFQHNNQGIVVIMIGLQCLVAFLLCLYAVFHRNSYYTMDDGRLTHVKNGIEQWSHTWDEIDHAKQRIVSTGKAFIIYYDITTKDGVKHRSLPASLGKTLKQRVPMDNSVNPWLITLILICIVIVGVLLVLMKNL